MTEWDDAAIDRQLANIYYAAGDPASFGGVDRLYRRSQELGIPANKRRVSAFLTRQQSYTLHKPVKHKFKRNKTIVSGIDHQWQADLADMQALAKENDGYNYLLTCIDVLSRYAWVVPIKSKSAPDMLRAIRELLRVAQPRKPARVQTDKGREFFNSSVRAFLASEQIQHFASNSDQKAALVERFNRTLKTRIWNFFTANATSRYVDILPDIVYSYNNSFHRSIAARPADVSGADVEQRIWKRLYYDDWSKQNTRQHPLAIGQRVRLSRWKGEFEKGYMPNWSREHFTVSDTQRARRGNASRTVYKLLDTSGEPIEGAIYPEEVQAIQENAVEVDRILKTRGRGANVEVLVKWKGWPEKFNRWIRKSDLPQFQVAPRDRQRPLQ